MTNHLKEIGIDYKSILDKSKYFISKASNFELESYEFTAYSISALQFLIKSILAKESPILLMDSRSFENFQISLLSKKDLKVRISDFNVCLTRANYILPGLKSEAEPFNVITHLVNVRNQEAHSSAISIENLKIDFWLYNYMQVSELILKHLSINRNDFFPAKYRNKISEIIIENKEKVLKSISIKKEAAKKYIYSNKYNWKEYKLDNHSDSFKTKIQKIVKCKYCKHDSILFSDIVKKEILEIQDSDCIEIKRTYKPHKFQCYYCNFSLDNPNELRMEKLSEIYVENEIVETIEYFQLRDLLENEIIENFKANEMHEDLGFEMQRSGWE